MNDLEEKIKLLEKDKELLEKYKHMFRNANFEKNGFPFICGTLGKECGGGLHEGYMICAAFGSDNVGSFMIKRETKNE